MRNIFYFVYFPILLLLFNYLFLFFPVFLLIIHIFCVRITHQSYYEWQIQSEQGVACATSLCQSSSEMLFATGWWSRAEPKEKKHPTTKIQFHFDSNSILIQIWTTMTRVCTSICICNK